MYAREVDGQTLTLAVDGRLWKDTMLMYDRETGSRWSQFLGEAISGHWKGKVLEQIPSVLTDWETWRRRHPDGTVVALDRSRREFTRAAFREPGRFVLGIATDGKAKVWNLADLSRARLLNDWWDGKPVLVVFDRRSRTARLYERTVKGMVLTFRRDRQQLVDDQTASTWEPVTGRATTGRLAGHSLIPLPAGVIYRRVWELFHPPHD